MKPQRFASEDDVPIIAGLLIILALLGLVAKTVA